MSPAQRADLPRSRQMRGRRAGLTADVPSEKEGHSTTCPRCNNNQCTDDLEHAMLFCPAMKESRKKLLTAATQAWSPDEHSKFEQASPHDQKQINLLLRPNAPSYLRALSTFHRELTNQQMVDLDLSGRTDEADQVRRFQGQHLDY